MNYLAKRVNDIFQQEGGFALVKRILSYPLKILFAFYYSASLKKLPGHIRPEELIEFAFNSHCNLLQPFQMKEEILKLVSMAADVKPKNVIEIGTLTGGTLFLLSRVASDEAAIISIDLPHGPFGGGYHFWKIPLFKSFASKRQKIHLIRSDSHSAGTLLKVKNILNGAKVDFLYIDGDHTYEGVKKDFEMYSPLVIKGGMVAFHDIAATPPEPGADVNRFWEEAKRQYRHTEIINNTLQKGCGIGVLFID